MVPRLCSFYIEQLQQKRLYFRIICIKTSPYNNEETSHLSEYDFYNIFKYF